MLGGRRVKGLNSRVLLDALAPVIWTTLDTSTVSPGLSNKPAATGLSKQWPFSCDGVDALALEQKTRQKAGLMLAGLPGRISNYLRGTSTGGPCGFHVDA